MEAFVQNILNETLPQTVCSHLNAGRQRLHVTIKWRNLSHKEMENCFAVFILYLLIVSKTPDALKYPNYLGFAALEYM